MVASKPVWQTEPVDHLPHFCTSTQGLLPVTKLLQVLSNLAPNTSRDGAATISLDNLFKFLTTLIVYNYILIRNYTAFKTETFIIRTQAFTSKKKRSRGWYTLSRFKRLFCKLVDNVSDPALSDYKENTNKTKQTVCVCMWEHFQNNKKRMLAWIPCVCSCHVFYI